MNCRKRIPITVFCLVAALTIGCRKAPDDPAAIQAAIQAAIEWVQLIDGGRYAESWKTSADHFRVAVEEEEWVRSMQAFRLPLGAAVRREVASSRYVHSLPGIADGEYVVIEFRTVFENKKEAVETVTPMLSEDGTWRVSGYYIK
jgi:hypothetical protein